MKCKYVKTNGINCMANAISDSEFCFMHDPQNEEAKLAAVTKGGLSSKKFLLHNNEEVVLETAVDAKRFLGLVINGVWCGEIPATPVANTLGFLVRCFLDAHEKSEIEARLVELEKSIEEVKHV